MSLNGLPAGNNNSNGKEAHDKTRTATRQDKRIHTGDEGDREGGADHSSK